MSVIKDIWEKIKNGRQDNEPEEELPDDVTRDKHLRSLRREDRVMDEEEEKEYLIKKLAERKKQRLSKHLFGIKKKVKEKQLINALNKKKEVKVLSNRRNILKENKQRKTKQSQSFLGRYDL